MNELENRLSTDSSRIATGIEIRRTPIRSIQGLGENQQFELVEIAAATVPATAVVIVLDLSDSCGPMPVLLSRLPVLLAKLPRKWPVWVYCLSNPVPIADTELTNVGHIIDGSIDIYSLLADRTRRQAAAGCGSFIGIVIEAIHERRAIEGLDEAFVVVATDGKLTDFSPVAVFPGLRLAGLTDNPDKFVDLVWRRVFPNQRLFRLTDSGLDAWLGSNRQPPNRRYLVNVQGKRLEASRYLSSNGSLQPIQPFEWDSRIGPCRLLLPATTADSFVIILSPIPNGPQLRLNVSTASNKPSDESVAVVTAALQPASQDRNVLINCTFGENGFDDLWKAVAAGAQCCDQKRRWQEMLPTTDPILRRTREYVEYPAALCLCRDDPMQPIKASSHVVVIGLSPTNGFAINWGPLQSTPFGTPVKDWRLSYDQMEGRWLLSRDGESAIELSPRGSQRLGAIKLIDGTVVEILFSGDL